MHCEICGGSLTMQSGGKAVCSLCGMEYSVERLREKFSQATVTPAPAPTPAPSPQQNSNTESMLKMAKMALSQKEYNKVISLCDQILQQDFQHFDAWEIKIHALWTSGEKENAASSFAEVSALIKDQAKRSQFIETHARLFLTNLSIYDDLVLIATQLSAADKQLAEKYLQKVFYSSISQEKKSTEDLIAELSKFNREAQYDARYYSLMGSSCNRARWLSSDIECAEKVWLAFGEEFSIENALLEFVDILSNATYKIDRIMETRKDIAELHRRARILADKIYSKVSAIREAAIEKFRKEHSEEIQRLKAKRDELKAKLRKMTDSIETCESALLLAKRKEEHQKLLDELARTGIFAFKKRKELKEQLALSNINLAAATSQHAEEKRRITIQITPIERELAKVEDAIDNLEDPVI